MIAKAELSYITFKHLRAEKKSETVQVNLLILKEPMSTLAKLSFRVTQLVGTSRF